MGAIGKGDEFAKQLKDRAALDGVNTLYYESPTSKTGTCAVLIRDKERSLVANLGAANDFKVSFFETPAVQVCTCLFSFKKKKKTKTIN